MNTPSDLREKCLGVTTRPTQSAAFFYVDLGTIHWVAKFGGCLPHDTSSSCEAMQSEPDLPK
jgi:hypothetical protein